MVRHSVRLFSAKWVPVRVTTLVETAVVPYKKEPEPHKWSHHYNLGLSRMTKYMYIYINMYLHIYIYLIIYIYPKCSMQSAQALVHSGKRRFFSEVPLLPLLMMIFPREPGFGQPPVSPTWLSWSKKTTWLPHFMGLQAVAGCVANSEKRDYGGLSIAYRIRKTKKQLLHLDTPTSTTSFVHLADDLNKGKPRQAW